MQHQVDEAAVGRVRLEHAIDHLEWARLHDLEAPEGEIRAVGPQRTVDGRALAGVLPKHDRRRCRALQVGPEAARIGTAAEPHRIARLDSIAVAAQESGGKIPRIVGRAGSRTRPVGRLHHVVAYVRAWRRRRWRGWRTGTDRSASERRGAESKAEQQPGMNVHKATHSGTSRHERPAPTSWRYRAGRAGRETVCDETPGLVPQRRACVSEPRWGVVLVEVTRVTHCPRHATCRGHHTARSTAA